jgi:hypothetical protein
MNQSELTEEQSQHGVQKHLSCPWFQHFQMQPRPTLFHPDSLKHQKWSPIWPQLQLLAKFFHQISDILP